MLGVIGTIAFSGCTTLTGDDQSAWKFEPEGKDVEVTDRQCGARSDSASVEFGSSSDPFVTVNGKFGAENRCDRLIASLYSPTRSSDEDMVIIRVRTIPPDGCDGCEATFRYGATFDLDRQPSGVDVYHEPLNGSSKQVAVERRS